MIHAHHTFYRAPGEWSAVAAFKVGGSGEGWGGGRAVGVLIKASKIKRNRPCAILSASFDVN